jgi:hypothetical protein
MYIVTWLLCTESDLAKLRYYGIKFHVLYIYLLESKYLLFYYFELDFSKHNINSAWQIFLGQ